MLLTKLLKLEIKILLGRLFGWHWHSDIIVILSHWHIVPTGGTMQPLGVSSYTYGGTRQLLPMKRLPIL